MEAGQNGNQSNRPRNTTQNTSVNGIKQLSLSSASPAVASNNVFASLHVHLEEDISASHSATATFEASHTLFAEDTPAANIVNESGGQWALYDTGVTHYMFKTDELFTSSSLTKINNTSKRLKLAGGEAPLAVHSTGTVKLKSGSRKMFELNYSLCARSSSKSCGWWGTPEKRCAGSDSPKRPELLRSCAQW